MPRRATKSGRDYSAAEKLMIVNKVMEGQSKASVGRFYDIPESTLRGWCKAAEQQALRAKSSVSPSSQVDKSSSSGDSYCEDNPDYKYVTQWIGSQWGLQAGALSTSPVVAGAGGYYNHNHPLVSPGGVAGSPSQMPLFSGLSDLGTRLDINEREPSAKESEALDLSYKRMTVDEAIHHGEKFLECLDLCCDPRVTQFNVNQVRKIVNSLKQERPAEML